MKEQNELFENTSNDENKIEKERQKREAESRRKLEAEKKSRDGRLTGVPAEREQEPLRGRMESPRKREKRKNSIWESFCTDIREKLCAAIFEDNFYDDELLRFARLANPKNVFSISVSL